jgi:uncharacterized ion transporter superfamily protein YfcC
LKSASEVRFTNLMFILGGVLMIAVAIGRLDNNIEYLPTDVRSQPWFDPLLSSIGAILGLFFVVVGTLRLLRDRRRNKR